MLVRTRGTPGITTITLRRPGSALLTQPPALASTAAGLLTPARRINDGYLAPDSAARRCLSLNYRGVMRCATTCSLRDASL